jgi:Ca-activated chloride channel family protein
MARLMRCQYCGTLQDEPMGAKTCVRCGGQLTFEAPPPPEERSSYLQVQMELDQVMAPAGQNVERHLLVTLRAPAQVPRDQAAPTQVGRPPLGFTAALDVSGSMRGSKIKQAQDAVRQALARLHDGDGFSLVVFSSDVRCAIEPTTISDQARRVVRSLLDEVSAGGMTALCGGLELGLEKAAQIRYDSNLVLLLSDGQANVGETDIERVAQRALGARGKGLVVSTLGVGSDYNEALMVEIANQGGGRFYHVQHAEEISAYLAGELGEFSALAAREAQIHLVLPKGAVIMPLSSAYLAQQGGDRAVISIGDIPCDTELEVPIRIALPGQATESRLSVEGAVSYTSPAGNRLQSSLNRVTLRCVEQGAFHLRDGVVEPVVERVLEHIRAADVLGVARAMTEGAAASAQRIEESRARSRAYASLLGDERAAAEEADTWGALNLMSAAPGVAKEQVSAAFRKIRRTKDFGKKESST